MMKLTSQSSLFTNEEAEAWLRYTNHQRLLSSQLLPSTISTAIFRVTTQNPFQRAFNSITSVQSPGKLFVKSPRPRKGRCLHLAVSAPARYMQPAPLLSRNPTPSPVFQDPTQGRREAQCVGLTCTRRGCRAPARCGRRSRCVPATPPLVAPSPPSARPPSLAAAAGP